MIEKNVRQATHPALQNETFHALKKNEIFQLFREVRMRGKCENLTVVQLEIGAGWGN